MTIAKSYLEIRPSISRAKLECPFRYTLHRTMPRVSFTRDLVCADGG